MKPTFAGRAAVTTAQSPDPSDPEGSATPIRSGRGSTRRIGLVVVTVCLLLAGAAGALASDAPDGLERVAEDRGLSEQARPHLLADGPVADYSVRALPQGRVADVAAGALGVLGTLGLAGGLMVLLRRAGASTSTSSVDPSGAAIAIAGPARVDPDRR